ncbi:hypothetical protein WJR50_33790 [Catalinimonas sp. 4WD22]|uniref:hypothetical protein n=1 Tax=Catalinimonas locisalis TaxID=3133978 RepID=UPI00310194B0
MKNSILIAIAVIIATIFILYNLPMELYNRKEIERGNELIKSIDRYHQKEGNFPANNDWETLRKIGFTSEEMGRAYPEIRNLNDSTYELIFTIGFDPPYLMWNSNERKWKEDFPSIPESWMEKDEN